MLWRGVNPKTRNLIERRTATEVTAIRHWLEHGFIFSGWVNSDRQLAEGLTKPQAAWKLLEIMSAGKWRTVWDPMFQSARKLKLKERSEGKRDVDGLRFLCNHSAILDCLLKKSRYTLAIFHRLQS